MTITASRDHVLRRAGRSDHATLAAIVAAAFYDDPVTCWLLPDEAVRTELSEAMFAINIEPYLANGEIYLDESESGAAVWLPAGSVMFASGAEEEHFGEQIGELLGAHIARFVQLGEAFAEHHPHEPHYYCQFLATLPEHQGKGIGSAFLRDMLARADADGMPAYHEATSARNRVLYERHGYVSYGEIVLPDGGPTLWRMWREPR